MSHIDLQAIDRALCGEIWAGDAARRALETLCLEYGGRFAGSEDDRRAAEFVAQLWREVGLADVRLEPFFLTAWERGAAAFVMTAPVERRYPCLALPYAPACDLDAELFDLGFGLEADIAQAGEAVRGKIALVRSGAPPGQRAQHRLEKYVRVKEAGAAAFVFADGEAGMLAPTGSLAFDQDGPLDQALPSAGVAYETALELERWARRGPVRMRLHLENRLWRATSWNVIGELPGSLGSDGPLVMLSAHLDGHDIAQAAIDNASGVVAISEIARGLAGQREQLRATVRFVCFGAEELGMLGSYAHAASHAAELERLRFLFNLDCVGTGGALGFCVQNAAELEPAFQQWSQEMGAEVNVNGHLVPFSDHFPFTLRGLPSAFIATAGTDRRGWGHTIADTLDKVSVQAIRNTAAIVARLALRLAADAVPWPGRRHTAAEVQAALLAAGVEPLMRSQGVWPF